MERKPYKFYESKVVRFVRSSGGDAVNQKQSVITRCDGGAFG